jgi:hypothetical protein
LQTVLDIVGEHWFLVDKVVNFLHGHVYTWETLYLHFLRNDVMHFDVSHSSAHEGTNHGLKSHSCAIKPIMNLDTSSNTMSIQSSIKVKECEDIIFQEATCTHKRWSDLPTSPYTTSVGEGILQGEMSRVNQYVAKLVSKQTGTSRFQVCYRNTRTFHIEIQEFPGTISNIRNDTGHEKNDSLCDTVPLSPIPIFLSIRSVAIDDTRTMSCSCKHFERIGLPCVHMVCVAKLCHETSVFGSHTSKFSGFTHHDIAVRWWSSYVYYAYQFSTPSHIIKKYHLLAMNPIKGPEMRCNVPQLLEIYDAQQILPAIDHLKNYPRNQSLNLK